MDTTLPLPEYLFQPAYIAIDKDGSTGSSYSYVTEQHLGRVIKFSSTGSVVAIFGGPPPIKREDGRGEREDSKEWVGDWRGRVHLSLPEGIALDKEGNIYVADRLHNRIVKLDPGREPLNANRRGWLWSLEQKR